MASKSMNNATDVLARQQAAERDALKAAGTAGAAVQRAQERRAVELERLDQNVTDAERGADLALAVLAALVGADRSARLTGETLARLRLAQQRASVEDVGKRVQELTGDDPAQPAEPAARRRGRPPGRSADRGDRGGGARETPPPAGSPAGPAAASALAAAVPSFGAGAAAGER